MSKSVARAPSQASKCEIPPRFASSTRVCGRTVSSCVAGTTRTHCCSQHVAERVSGWVARTVLRGPDFCAAASLIFHNCVGFASRYLRSTHASDGRRRCGCVKYLVAAHCEVSPPAAMIVSILSEIPRGEATPYPVCDNQ